MDKLRFLVETFMDYQKDRIRLENRVRSLPAEVAGETFFKALSRDVRALEKSVEEEIKRELENEPLWTNYLSRINGVGPLMAGYLIAWLCRPRIMKVWKVKRQNVTLPPYAKVLEQTKQYIIAELPPVMEVATNPSKIHAYCGLKPGSRPVRGEALDYNPKLKTLSWKLLRQMLMANAKKPSKYAELYEKVKAEYAERCQKPEKGSLKLKIHFTAKNITMRIFMTNLWITYRRMKGLSVTTPYPAKLGEKHKIYTPEELLDK